MQPVFAWERCASVPHSLRLLSVGHALLKAVSGHFVPLYPNSQILLCSEEFWFYFVVLLSLSVKWKHGYCFKAKSLGGFCPLS